MKEQIVRQTSEVYYEDYNLYIYIVKNSGNIFALDFNFNGYQEFRNFNLKGNPDLFDMYLTVLPYLSGATELEKIAQAIMIYADLRGITIV
jgi:hypothetical protein